MGLVGAGTNNARLVQMLRQLAGYYYKEPDLHMGKGTIGLNPFFSDRSIMSRPAIAGLLATLTAFTDGPSTYHWMMYFLVTTMYPRFLITVDEELNSMPVTVRVGQVSLLVLSPLLAYSHSARRSTSWGKLGRRARSRVSRRTRLRLATTERAELATEEFIPFGHVLEGFVILQKNPGWEKEDKMEL
ncbi:hypothetical protein FB451DRAFT_1525582 [Mycena latifolia]|nr:hypothetical protein FB451DRAFT_1525582 [Mycena latifolia]